MKTCLYLPLAAALFALCGRTVTSAQPAISITIDPKGNSRTFLASHYDVPKGFNQLFKDIDNDVFTCTIVRPLREGDVVALMGSMDQAWSINKVPLLINGNRVEYPIMAEIIYGNTGYVLLPAVLKFKIDMKAGEILHSKGSPAFDIQAKRPIKAGESISVLYVNSGILAVEPADRDIKSNEAKPLVTAFPTVGAEANTRNQTIEAWRTVIEHVSPSYQNSGAIKGIENDSVGNIRDAAQDGDLAKVKALIESNPDSVFSKDSKGWTPLHTAAVGGHKEVVELLLANKADVNGKNISGWTPLHTAALFGHKEVVEFLLANKADVNGKNNDGETPLHLAMKSEHEDVAELLRQHGGHE